MQHVLFPRAGLGSLAVPISQCRSERIHLLWTSLASWRQLVWHPSSPESEAVDWAGIEATVHT